MLLIIGIFVTIMIESATSAANCNAVTSNACDAQILTCCDQNFLDALNITVTCGGPSFVNPRCIRREVERQYELGGQFGLLLVCSAFAAYHTCLDISEPQCTSELYLIEHQISPSDAQQIGVMFNQFHFACGPGMASYLLDDTCMALAFNTHSDDLNQCRKQFIDDITGDPNNVCAYFEVLTHCYQRPFELSCGAEAGWWACEYERTGVQPFLPQCPQQCTVTSSAQIG